MRPKDPGKTARMRRELREELKGKKTVVTIYIILRVLVILTMVAQFLNGNFENVFLCILTLVLFTLPSRHRADGSASICPTRWRSSSCSSSSPRRSWARSRLTTSISLAGTPCSTPSTAFSARPSASPWWTLFNRNERFTLSLSPVYLAVVAFCFSMTIGVLWEFFECIMDSFFLLDMQKDTVVHAISTVMLDPTGGNTIASHPGHHRRDRGHGGRSQHALGLGGYLDIGIIDTMKDLFVNFIGALGVLRHRVFSM